MLYKIEEKEIESNPIYDLSIDRALYNFSNDQKKNDYFCHVLSKPLCEISNIIYRREILNDFITLDGLFDAVKTVFLRYDKLKSDWIELRSNDYRSPGDKGGEAMLDYSYSSLKVTSIFPKTIISFFYAINETLSAFNIKSEGLLNIRNYAKNMIENESLNEIAKIASQFMYNSTEDYDFTVLCSLNDRLSVFSSEVTDVSKREKKKNSILSKFGLRKDNSGYINVLDPAVHDDAVYILTEALYAMDKQLSEITDSIYSTFYGISIELDFYEIAMKYNKFLNSNSPVCCYADFENQEFSITELYDFFLMTEGCDKLLPHDINLNSYKGALIKGKNNTGKTTFLRSLATAQLFSQAGLPIAAHSASLLIFGAIFTHFSSSEEDFISGDSAGRFEGEVRSVSKIINSLEPYSLVILNETFQTTSYDEGGRAMTYILKSLIKSNCFFVFVTHLTDIFDSIGDSVAKLETSNEDKPYLITKI